MTWLRQLLEWQRETPDTNDFLDSVREDLFLDQVFVYTPKGDIMELAAGATPIDFAYKIHTDLGHRISGAKVNGRLVSLDTPLENGDTVEVVAGKTGRGPSPDWLNKSRGYVATNSARQKIRSWFNRQASQRQHRARQRPAAAGIAPDGRQAARPGSVGTVPLRHDGRPAGRVGFRRVERFRLGRAPGRVPQQGGPKPRNGRFPSKAPRGWTAPRRALPCWASATC